MRRGGAIYLTVGIGWALSTQALAKKDIVPESAAERLELLQTAQVWQPVDTASFDMFQGVDDKFEWGQTVKCTFMEPDPEDPPGGKTPKFKCLDVDGDDHKVKYGLHNGEVYGEVLASRLLQSLGFGADRYYPVRIECTGCPRDPWTYIKDVQSGLYKRLNRLGRHHADFDRYPDKFEKWEKRDRIFIPAIIEKKFEGPKIEQHDDQGWGWDEFAVMDRLTKEQRIHRQALAALMGMLQHADNKRDQQRIHCLKEHVYEFDDHQKCREAFLIVHDLGWTFGHGWKWSDPANISKVKLADWKREPIFDDQSTCEINLNSTPKDSLLAGSQEATWVDFNLSEEGRKFLVSRLKLLSRQQIEDLFRASRLKLREPIVVGGIPDTIVYAWADAFEEKVRELESARCPPMGTQLVFR